MFFKNCAPKLLLSSKLILVSSQAEVDAKKLIYKKKTIEILLKQRLNFYLNTRRPLLMFLRLIPLTMVDHAPRNLFDIGEDAWSKYITSRTRHWCIEPNNLPGFNNVAKYVKTTENPMIRTINQKPHYFLALLVA